MRTVHSVLIAAVFAAALPLQAQEPRLQDRLSPADFRAAGLDKLSAAELARLDALLARQAPATAPLAVGATPDVELRIAQAREEGRLEAQAQEHGLRAPRQARTPIESTLPGPFTGFSLGREYTLANGQVWKQIDNASIAGARGQDIGVRIRPGFMNVWWLQVDGYNTQTRVERVR